MNEQTNTSALIERYNACNKREKEAVLEQIISENEKLIVYLIKKYYPSYIAMHYEDLLQEGREAIIVKIAGYDESKGAFTTYITNHIVNKIMRYIAMNIHGLSPYYLNELKKLHRAGDSPLNEMANKTGLSIKVLQRLLGMRQKTNTLSIDDEKNPVDIPDNECVCPQEELEAKELHKALMSAVQMLPIAQRDVIICKYYSAPCEVEITPEDARKLGMKISGRSRARTKIIRRRELSLREISARTGYSVTDVRRHLNMALLKLSKDPRLVGIMGCITDDDALDIADSDANTLIVSMLQPAIAAAEIEI